MSFIKEAIKNSSDYFNARADKDIEKNRKGDFLVEIKSNEKTLNVSYKLKLIDFDFGCNIFMLGQYDDKSQEKTYLKQFKNLFNTAVVPLYWEGTEPKQNLLRYSAYSKNDIYRRPAVDYMKKQNWGRIVTIGSVQEAKPHPDMLVYSASKAAQTNMVQSLSLQLAPYKITVNNVAPGVIYTDRNVSALVDEEYRKKVIASIPLGFYGVPEDIAGMVSLLCSEDGRYITGQNIFIDGGKSVQ